MSTADLWSEGAAYERFMGRWSRRVAVEFVDWLDIPAGLRWLDIGCGTGALTAAVLSRADPVSIRGTDPSEAFVATAARQVDDPRAQFVVADAATTPSGRVDVVVAGLVVNF
ncbi:MAG TPA: class I SAM-dependent methyltransferase, partial [Jiangellaceae bacterium]|nr:class I SAM-dependent methyltransferase [Jiangellaceae bacterium]